MAWHDSWKNMKKKPANPQPKRRPARVAATVALERLDVMALAKARQLVRHGCIDADADQIEAAIDRIFDRIGLPKKRKAGTDADLHRK
jgi:hypothetical protein